MAKSKNDILVLLKKNVVHWLGHLTRTRIWLGDPVNSLELFVLQQETMI